MAESDLETRIAWQHHVGTSPAADAWYASVMARHREPQRHYHDDRHVRWVVRQVRELGATRPVSDLDALIVAAFFHDAIYDPTASDNETASAALAVRAVGELSWPTERATLVAELISGTQHHHAASLDEAVLFAADLSVLAADPAAYSDYVRNVRREYAHVSDTDWVTGRAAVLESFIDRSAIYSPELELPAWEARARANIAAELGTLIP